MRYTEELKTELSEKKATIKKLKARIKELEKSQNVEKSSRIGLGMKYDGTVGGFQGGLV